MDAAREVALGLPRSYEALVGGRVKFRVGRIVYLAFSADEALMGFAFPKEMREALIKSDPQKFVMPRSSDLRYNWVRVRLAAIDDTEMRALVVDAWAMVVPKGVVAAHFPFEESSTRTRAEIPPGTAVNRAPMAVRKPARKPGPVTRSS